MDFYTYFQSHNNYFWEWEDDANIISISNGKTIAYREYIFQVIESLAEQGVPPFGGLLLALIATNRDAIENLEYIKKSLSDFLSENFHFHSDKERNFIDAFSFLELLIRLPEAYKKGDKRLILLQTLFADCHNKIASNKAKRIKDYPQNNPILVEKLFTNQSFSTKVYFDDFRAVGLLWRHFPSESMLLEILADIPELHEPLKIIEEPIEEIENIKKDFTQQLIENEATFEIGRLIKPLWAGFKIPINQNFQAEQPLGGVSDLSNKGDFDKLLISEFANDDLLFLSRLANNEALFLHREIPPAHDQTQRVLLLDISLKNWGIPKTLAYATALAIAKHPKNNTNTQIFAVGKGFKAIQFENIHQIIEEVQQVDPSLEASAGIESFLKQYTHIQKMELFLVTSLDSLKMPKMQIILNDYRTYFKYIVTVEHEGNISFYRNQHSGRHLLQKIQLSLNELWKKDASLKTKKEEKLAENYWLNIPILLPAPTNIKVVQNLDEKNGYYCINKNNSLFYSPNLQKGWVLVIEKLPDFIICKVGRLKNGAIILCLLHEQQVIMINLNTKEQKINPIKLHQKIKPTENLGYSARSENFYYDKNDNTWAMNWQTNSIEKMTFGRSNIVLKKTITEPLFIKNDFIKNVKRVYINYNNQLVINNHALDLNVQGTIKWKQVHTHKALIESTFDYKNSCFYFKNGSRIGVNEWGISRWVSAELPTLYVPMVIERHLGVASEAGTEGGYFAGYSFYQRADEVCSNQKAIGTKVFWVEFFEPFIKNIINGVTN